MARANIGAIPGTGQVARRRVVKSARRAPAPSPRVSAIPGVGPRAVPTVSPPHRAPARRAAPRPTRTTAVPGVSGAVASNPHLARHRANRARQAPRTQAEATARDLGSKARTALSLISPLIVGQPQMRGQAKVNRDPLATVEGLTSGGGIGIAASALRGLAGESDPFKALKANLGGQGAWQSLVSDIQSREKGHDPLLQGLPGGRTVEEGLTSAAKDALNLAANVVPSTYLPLRDIAHGKPGKALKAVTDPYKALLDDPAGFIHEHPVAAYLMLSGGKAAVGRSAGAGMRAIGRAGVRSGSKPMQAVGRAAQTYRGSATLPGTKVEVSRYYSPDVITKGAQVLLERHGPRQGKRRLLVQRAEEASKAGNHELAQTLTDRAEKLDPLRVRPGDIRQHVDSIVAAAEEMRREHRQAAMGTAGKLIKQVPRGQRGALRVVAEGVVRGNRQDIEAYIAELGKVHDEAARGLSRKEVRSDSLLRSNRLLRHRLQKALSGKEEDFAALRKSAREYGQAGKALERQLVEAKMLNPAQAEKAALIPAAARRVGARRDVPEVQRLDEAMGGKQWFHGTAHQGPLSTEGPEGLGLFMADRRRYAEAFARARAEGRGGERVVEFRHTPRHPLDLRDLDLAAHDHRRALEAAAAFDRVASAAEAVGVDANALRRGAKTLRSGRSLRHPNPYEALQSVAQAMKRKGVLAKDTLRAAGYDSILQREGGAAGETLAAFDMPVEQHVPVPAEQESLAQRIVDAEGKPLTLDQLRAMRFNELQLQDVGGEPAFVSQAPRRGGGKNMYVSWFPRAGVGKTPARSGEATRLGSFESHPVALVEQHARMQGLIDADRAYKDFADYMGFRQDGALVIKEGYGQASGVAERLTAETGITWRPVRARPLGDNAAEMVQSLMEDTHGDPLVEGDITHAMQDALTSKGEGRYIVVPDVAAQQLSDHLGALRVHTGKRIARQLNSAFRKAVLTTNPRWLYGNAAEAAFRTALQHGFNPVDVYLSVRHMRAVVKEMRDPAEARALEAAGDKPGADALRKAGEKSAEELATYGWQGGLYQGAGSFHVIHNRADRYPEGSMVRSVAEGLERAKETPLGLLPKGWEWWTRKVFVQLNGTMERFFQQTMAGKESRRMVGARRDAELFDPNTMGPLTETAVAQAARGLRGTAQQIELGRRVMRAYGQYHSWGPSFRALMENYTPFLSWTWNSFRFLTSVLPKDHPIFTGLLAAVEVNADRWLKDHGLGWFGARAQLPDFLQGTIPDKGGSHRNPGRMLPFGFGADPLGTAASNVLPQYSAPLLALGFGKDWKGADLPGKDNPLERLKAAALSFAGSEVPLFGQAQRAIEKGQTPGEALTYLLNPVPEIKGKGGGGGLPKGVKPSSGPSFNYGGGDNSGSTHNWGSGSGDTTSSNYNWGP